MKLNNIKSIKQLERYLDVVVRGLHADCVENALSLGGFATIEDLRRYEYKGGFGLDCGWAKISFGGEFGKHVSKLYKKEYGYTDTAISVRNVLGVQSTTAQSLSLQPVIEFLNAIGIECSIEITLD